MYRSMILCLAVAAPAAAQRGDESPPQPAQQPPVITRQPVLPLPRAYSLSTDPRAFGNRVDTGLVTRRAPDESEIDMEAVLRAYLPDEETLRRDEVKLRPTIARMQGIWRVQKMVLDGAEIPPSEFVGTKYLIQDRVIFQSETSETWTRVWPVPPERIAVVPPAEGPLEPGLRPRQAVPPPPVDVMPLGPAGVSRPAGTERREDPRQEEGVRMNMLYQGEGRARVFWWNRYGETADPHLSRNRPSLRVSLPTRGNIQVGDNELSLEVRGFGLRSVLPSKYHLPFNLLAPVGREGETPLEPDRKVTLVLVRDEAQAPPVKETRENIIRTLQRVPLEREP